MPVTGDTIYETDETFTLTLSNPTGATITTGTATGTIVNDDLRPLLMIASDGNPEGNTGSGGQRRPVLERRWESPAR